MKPISVQRPPAEMFHAPTLEVAHALLGMELHSTLGGAYTAGRIVEVEAYLGSQDPASHAYRGPSPRTAAMFKEGGHCYVYFVYGMHHCVNIVTGPGGTAGAVLIRAVEPLQGVSVMRERRAPAPDIALTNGPGKLCQALAINLEVNGEDLRHSQRLWLAGEPRRSLSQVIESRRIGITRATERRWRFYLAGNRYVSRILPDDTPLRRTTLRSTEAG